MATMKRAGPGIKDHSVADAAGIRPYKIDAAYSGPAAFLTAKSARYNSSTAEPGDWFISTWDGSIVTYRPRLTAAGAGASLIQGTSPTATWTGGKNVHIVGSQCAPVSNLAGVAGAVATGADTTITNVSLGYNYPNMAIYNSGANTTNENPITLVDANCTDGLQLPSTNTDNVGAQISFGTSLPNLLATPNCATNFKVGTDPAFFVEARIGIPDISDYDIFFVGFVEPAAYVAAANMATAADLQTAYDEKAGIAIADNAGAINTYTSLAGADVATALTATAWADDAVKTLRVDVSAAGAVTYRLWAGNTEDTSLGTVAFSFADATIVTPMIILVKCANAADTPPILEYIKWGHA